jgi:hypothetical protein
MGFFNSWKSHYTVGYAYGLTLRTLSKSNIEKKILDLDLWGWDREWKQNLKSNSPHDVMSEHKMQEARAWGQGARKSSGLNPPFPVPPYLSKSG